MKQLIPMGVFLLFLSLASLGILWRVHGQTLVMEPIPQVADAAMLYPTLTVTPTPTPTMTPTPTPIPPTPTPRPVPWTTQELEEMFTRVSRDYNVDREFLKKIAYCESEFNPHAGSGEYIGLYQFSESTWVATRTQMGADTNLDLRKNADESMRTAAFKLARGGYKAWPVCYKY